jgi:hypothetical protein
MSSALPMLLPYFQPFSVVISSSGGSVPKYRSPKFPERKTLAH